MNRHLALLLALFMVWLPLAPVAAAQTYQVGTLTAGSVNGTYFPARCGDAHPQTWCSGTTPDQWILAACSQITTSGIVDMTGLVGNIAATTRGCSTTTKQIALIETPSTNLTITETDGDGAFPLDNTSMLIGPGVGQCLAGIHLASSAVITSVVGPAHTDGTQENFAVSGACITGAVGATVTQAMMFAKNNFANTTFQGNVVTECNTYCLKIQNGSDIRVFNNWLNASGGNTSIVGQPLLILGSGNGTGFNIGPVEVFNNQMEHAQGANSAEVTIEGDGAGALAGSIHLTGNGIERDSSGTPSTTGVRFIDCQDCWLIGMAVSGGSGGTDAVNVSQTAAGRTQNVEVGSILGGGAYTNALADATPGGRSFTFTSIPHLTRYVAQPGLENETFYSAASNPLPTCAVQLQGQDKTVIDATSPTYLGAYASGGNITAQVICSYNGSTYGWVTH